MSKPQISCQNLSLTLSGRDILKNIDLELYQGEVLCLLGPSGCGKSSTLRVISGIQKQTNGEIYFDEQLIANEKQFVPAEKRGIGMMFQDFALFPNLTVEKNIGFTGANQNEVKDLLERIGLLNRAKDYPHQLSGGEQQRVALARALAAKPRVLLMDEPFSGLDDRLRDQLREACFEILRENQTSTIMVTHDPAEAMRVADRIALMRDGQIVQVGAPYNLYNNPVDREAASFFSDVNILTGKVHEGSVDTPFGYFLTPGCDHGQEIEIVIRPQHIKMDFDRGGRGPSPTPSNGVAARGEVRRARFLGRESLVEFRMDFENVKLHATVPSVFLPQPGSHFWLSVRRDRVHVFRRTGELCGN